MRSNGNAVWFISKYSRLPSQSSYPFRGFSLLKYLTKFGYDCTLFTASHELSFGQILSNFQPNIFVVDGVKIVQFKILNYKKTKSLSRILGWLEFELKMLCLKLKLVSTPNFIIASSLSIFSVLTGLFYKCKFKCLLIFEVRDVWPLVLTSNAGMSKFNPFVVILSFIEWVGYKYSDKIVATMPNLEPHVAGVLGASKTVTCIPMGVPDELILSKPLNLPAPHSGYFEKNHNKFIITYAGSIGIDNALDTLFVAARILKANAKIRFFIMGDGDLLVKYKRIAADLPNVHFADPVPSNMVLSVLAKSSVLYFAAHPTLVLQYGQSLNKIIDYMYSGRPIVASFSGYPSMINEADCGFFVPADNPDLLAEKIARISEISSNELDSIGKKGREWVLEHRRYATLAADYAELLTC